MRTITGILLVAVLAVGAFFGYCWYGAQMQLVGAGTAVTPAADAGETFSSLRWQLSEGSFCGDVLRQVDLGDASEYSFVTVNVRMKNIGLFPMEWIRIEVKPVAADILQLAPEGDPPTLARMSLGEYAATFLTQGDGGARTYEISYYVLGRKFTKEFTV